MKRFRWRIILGLTLVLASAAIYWLQVWLCRRPGDTFFYTLQDFAFLPIQVLLVTLVINEMLILRERAALHRKLNMVIGAFFSEVGTSLLKLLSRFDAGSSEIAPLVIVNADWSDRDFASNSMLIRRRDYAIDSRRGDLAGLRSALVEKRVVLLRLLANPSLLEHESFTEVLWAISHLAEELELRTDLTSLPDSDYDHLSGDIQRAYSRLLSEWVLYARHLKAEYPYLFSLVIRTNPFDPQASPIVK